MTVKNKSEELKKANPRYNEFLKYIQKRIKELERDEKKFREAVMKERKVN